MLALSEPVDRDYMLTLENLPSVLGAAFPILTSVVEPKQWQTVSVQFYQEHPCSNACLYDLAKAFQVYLQQKYRGELLASLPFAPELIHFEVKKLDLAHAERSIEDTKVDPTGNLLTGKPHISSVSWLLRYNYPVHRISKRLLPQKPFTQSVFIILYRNKNDYIDFLEVNEIIAELFLLLQQNTLITGHHALSSIACELHHPKPSFIIEGGLESLQEMLALDIILGTRC